MLAAIVAACFALGLIALVGGGVFGWYVYARIAADLPSVDSLRTYAPPEMSRVYAGNEAMIAEFGPSRRIFVPFSAIPKQVAQAFVSAEDKNFWTNGGIDPAAILRAAVTDLMQMGHGRRPIGASTITQQVARNMLLNSDKLSITRKIREAILAMRLEGALSKQRILELYLNDIYLGEGTYGVAAASETYFDLPLDRLDIAQAAFLGGLPKAPNYYNPTRHPDAARDRRNWVLDRMRQDGAITAAEADAAKAAPLVPASYQQPTPIPGSAWFADEVRRQLIDKFGASQALEGGLTVQTSLDTRLQAAAEKALRDGLMRYDRREGSWRGPVTHLASAPALLAADWSTELAAVGRPHGMLPGWVLAVVLRSAGGIDRLGVLQEQPGGGVPVARTLPMYAADDPWVWKLRVGDVVMAAPQAAAPGHDGQPERLALRQIPKVEGALATVDPRTGRVLAMVGGWSHEISQFDRATQAQRQPGSSFKPFVYLTAMEQGISPSQRFLDGPFYEDLGPKGVWAPHDYETGWLGEVPLSIALQKSLNLVTVRLAQRISMSAIAKTAIAFHMVDRMPHVLPAALGAVDTTVMREAGAYSTLDMMGREVVPSVVDTVQDRNGQVIWRNPALTCDCSDPSGPPVLNDDRKQIADQASVFQIMTMMRGVVQRGTGTTAVIGIDRPVAGKTGTSDDFHDAWFSGFTPDLVTVVWVGFDQPISLGKNQQGAMVAAPIWNEFMKVALAGRPKLDFTKPPGVKLASWDSGFGTITDAFKPGQVPGASGALASASQPDASQTAADAQALASGATSNTLDSQMGGLY
ncbi:MAG TPA: PBP1A family penicillin-binding protein [Acetobacteraceae bacterium]|nr:PBP1A family penicillin-binding protein [Acetobacteraceae bacterium]